MRNVRSGCARRSPDELELYGEVELRRGPVCVWWYGRWYSWVVPAGIPGGVRVDAGDLEEIGHAEFEMARAQRWVLGPSVDADDDEVVVSRHSPQPEEAN